MKKISLGLCYMSLDSLLRVQLLLQGSDLIVPGLEAGFISASLLVDQQVKLSDLLIMLVLDQMQFIKHQLESLLIDPFHLGKSLVLLPLELSPDLFSLLLEQNANQLCHVVVWAQLHVLAHCLCPILQRHSLNLLLLVDLLEHPTVILVLLVDLVGLEGLPGSQLLVA